MKIRRLTILCMALLLLAGCQGSAPEGTTDTTSTAPQTSEPVMTSETAAPTLTHVEVMREGEWSLIPVETVQGAVGNYTMAMDTERFTQIPMEYMDLYLYSLWEGKPVYYSVMPYSGSFERVVFEQYCVDRFGALYTDMSSQVDTVGEYRALRVTFSGLTEQPEYCRTVLLLDCGDSLWLLQAEYVMEMYEGLVPIMEALFATFRAE